MSDDGRVEDHRAYRTYVCVAGVVAVSLLSHFQLLPDALAAQLIGILLALSVAAMRYGQVQDAATVKTALKKQEVVVKAAIVEADEKNVGAMAEVAKSVEVLVNAEIAEAEHKEAMEGK